MKSFEESIGAMNDSIAHILIDNNPSIYLYGSCVLGDFRFGWSDIDILVLTGTSIAKDQAENLLMLRQRMQDTEPSNPYYRKFEGGMLSLRAFRKSG